MNFSLSQQYATVSSYLGLYHITVAVTDNQGAIGTKTISLQVLHPNPSAVITQMYQNGSDVVVSANSFSPTYSCTAGGIGSQSLKDAYGNVVQGLSSNLPYCNDLVRVTFQFLFSN